MVTSQMERRHWTPLEDSLLRRAVEQCRFKSRSDICEGTNNRFIQGQTHFGEQNWRLIANHVPGRDRKACRKRWCQSIGAKSRTGHWSSDEDARLSSAVQQHGPAWSRVAESVQTRNGDQCLKRWRDSLDPKLYRGPWTADEDSKLEKGVQDYNQNWKRICVDLLPERSALAIRHRFELLQKRRSVARQRLEAGPILFRDDVDIQNWVKCNPSTAAVELKSNESKQLVGSQTIAQG